MIRLEPCCPAHFLGGALAPAAGQPRPVVNPSTLATIGRIADATEAEIEAALSAAEAARPGWAGLDAKARARHLHAIAQSIETADHTEVARLMTLEMGKPFPEAIGEIANVGSVFRYFAEMARDEAGRVAGPIQPGSFQYSREFPYGISVHVVPYNFPILLMAWTVAASLAAGNVAIIKPAEATTLCTLAFMRHFAGLPAGVVGCLAGGAEVGRTLVESDRTHVVAFTGSVAVARTVATACAARLKPCVIEAGGNDALIVTDHGPLDVAVAGTVTAAFHLSGQICTSAERIIVHAAVHDEFVAKLVTAAKALRVGDGLGHHEIGPLVSEAARAKVSRLVDDAVAKGARIETGGRIPEDAGPGWFYEPTVLTGITDAMMISREELFGPVAAIRKVASFDEAVAVANRSEFGLGASVFTTELSEAMRAVEEIEAGMVWVNNPLVDNDALPFGGWKTSGLGRALGREGLAAFRRSKMAIVDPVPKIHDWWYPYPDDVFYRG